MESDSADRSIWVKALRGTEPDGLELTAVLADEAAEVLVVPTPEVRALAGGVRMPDEGVYCTDAVREFEPAEEEPEDAYEDAAPGPEPPAEELVWM
jgi:hypothetical protein